MEKTLSVVIPVYNGEKFIETIVESLFSQTFQDFEIVFVNDGSADQTASVLQGFTEKYPEKITFINQTNQGVSAARNNGIAHASGKYIAFVDVDDLLHPLFLEMLYNQIRHSEQWVAVCGQAKNLVDFETQKVRITELSDQKLLHAFLYGEVATGVCGMLIPKKLLEDRELLFRVGGKYSEDLHMVWRVFCFCEKATFIDAPLYIYRDVPGSAMSKIDQNRLDSMILIKELEAFFEKNHPAFAVTFKKYAVARMSWSLLWQAAHYLTYREFKEFIKLYDFKNDLKKLITFPDIRVKLSSVCFLISKRLYHFAVSIITKKYRS